MADRIPHILLKSSPVPAPLYRVAFLVAALLVPCAAELRAQSTSAAVEDPPVGHLEVPDDPPAPQAPSRMRGGVAGQTVWTRGPYVSVQVNVDEFGNNIPGDAANEPSIAVDPTSPNRIVIGWRQFDTIQSNFRQAGWAYSHDAGLSWQRTAPGVIEPGIFRSDPVLAADAEGNFYYNSLSTGGGYCYQLFKSQDGGVSWTGGFESFGGDKGWMTIDRTGGIGDGNIYTIWTKDYACIDGGLSRSTDGGETFDGPFGNAYFWGTLDVGPDGELYVIGGYGSGSVIYSVRVARSSNAQYATETPTFDQWSPVGLYVSGYLAQNPGGLHSQAWIGTDHSKGRTRGNVYALSSGEGFGVLITRSEDGAATWSEPVQINDEGGLPWFATMSVAPDGRIDVVWNDTRNSGEANLSELFYSYSTDAGESWSPNVPVSPMFDSHIGWPQQNKIGDYYHMVSDNAGANVAYAATFNGEQDVYFLRIGPRDCDNDGVLDQDEIAMGLAEDCNENLFPDKCERDCNANGSPDTCDVSLRGAPDCNANLIPDECESDFDGDGAIDNCDEDIDDDGVPNESDACMLSPLGIPVEPSGRPRADTTGTCTLDLDDFERLRTCLVGGGPGAQVPAFECLQPFDFDDDGDVDLGDVAAFVRFFGP